MKVARTDADVLRLTGIMQRAAWRLVDAINDLRECDHPAANAMADTIEANGYGNVCDFAHLVWGHLEHPERLKERSYSDGRTT